MFNRESISCACLLAAALPVVAVADEYRTTMMTWISQRGSRARPAPAQPNVNTTRESNTGPSTHTRFIAGPSGVFTFTVQPAQPPTAQAMNSSRETWQDT